MSGRPIRPAYLPPHMRNAAHAAEGAPRSLEELAPQSIKIKIEFTQSSPFSFDLCPDNFVEDSTEADSSNAQQQQQPAAKPEPLQQQEHPATTLQPAGSVDDQQQQHSPPTQADQSAAEPARPGATAPEGDPGPPHAAAREPGQSPAEPGAAAGLESGLEPGTNQPEGGGATSGASVPRKKLPLECRYLLSPACPDTYQIKQLLRWFREACREESDDFPKGDTRAVLSLPASLSKRERAMWHQEAERLALKSQSTGFGEDRFLQVRPSGNYSKSSWSSWNKPHSGPSSGGSSSSSRGHSHPHNAPRGPHSAAAAADGLEAQPSSAEAQPLSPTAAAAAARQPVDLDGEGFPEDHLQQHQQQQLAGDDASSSQRQQQRQQWGGWGGSSGRGGGGGGGGRRPPDFAKQLWDWCQLEGGVLWNYSQGEIRDALAAVGGDTDKLPPELAALVAKRRFSQQLAAALQSRDESAACSMLAECDPSTRLGWVRDPDSGGYPAHIAAWHGLTDFLLKLVERDGAEVLQQHDASRATPLQLAQQQGHTELAAALEQLHLQARGSSSSGTPPDVPPAPGERGFAAAGADADGNACAEAGAAAAGAAAGAAAAPVGGPTAGGGRGFGRAGFSRGRGRGSSAAPRPAAAAGAAESMGDAGGLQEEPAAAGAADTEEVLGQAEANLDAAAVNTGTAVTTDDSSKTADQGDADQQQQQQEDSRASQEQQVNAQQAEAGAEPGDNATAAAAAAPPPPPPPPQSAGGSDRYCSYASRDDRAYALYGRPAGRGGGGGGHYRGRGGGWRGGRWQGRGGWHGRGHGGWHGRGRGRGSSAEGGGRDGGSSAEGVQQQSEQ